jgi:hypothetical protein
MSDSRLSHVGIVPPWPGKTGHDGRWRLLLVHGDICEHVDLSGVFDADQAKREAERYLRQTRKLTWRDAGRGFVTDAKKVKLP